MQIEKTRFIYGDMSDIGKVRDENQDSYGIHSGAFGDLLLICDGMGGYKGGALASRMAVEIISEHFKNLGAEYDARYEIEQAAMQAQKAIKKYQAENPETNRMGTTLVLLLFREGSFWFAHIGDSRLYLKRDGEASLLTKDHSMVQEMVDDGLITAEQAKDHPKRNTLSRALGKDKCNPDISGPHQLNIGDVFVLCSDGLYEYFELEEISEYMDKEPQDACEIFVALANQRGGRDNITVQVVKISDEFVSDDSVGTKRSNWKSYLVWVVFLLALSFLIKFAFYLSGYEKKEIKADPSVGTEAIEQEKQEDMGVDSMMMVEPEKDEDG